MDEYPYKSRAVFTVQDTLQLAQRLDKLKNVGTTFYKLCQIWLTDCMIYTDTLVLGSM